MVSRSILANDAYAGSKPKSGVHDLLRPSYFSDLVRTVFLNTTLCPAVLLTAPHRGCGVSYVCSTIALEIGPVGGNVLLADAQALAALAGNKKIDFVRERIGASGVSVLGARHITEPAPAFAPVCPSVAPVLEVLAQEFTHIVIDAPAISASDLALRMSPFVDGVIFIARAGKTEKRQIKAMQRQFTALGAHVLGAVFNAY